ncbi:MAG: hypothetical protein ACR2M7_00570 [Bdellovibrionales bacterium]
MNIATHILSDDYEDKYECAVLISNDTDLKTPIKFVKNKLKKEIGILSTQKNIHKDLEDIADFCKRIKFKALKNCPFPIEMKDKRGQGYCPEEWRNI